MPPPASPVHQIFESHLGKGPEAAAQYLERLSQQHRYERDVWV